MSAYIIRRFAPGDLGGVLRVERASFGREAYDRNLFAEYARLCGDLFLVAEDGRGVRGYLIASLRRGRAELVSLAVAPAARGTGASGALLAAAVRRLRRRRAALVALMVKVGNARAIAFYLKSGFRRVRRIPRYYEDGADAFLMHRRLTYLA